jgi:hypothetical protein
MAVGPYNPDNILTIHPTVAVAARRFIQPNGEQATVQGQVVMGASEEAITAGGFGTCAIGGTVCVEAGAAIVLDRGPAGYPNTYAWVMTDANGRVIRWAAGNAVAGFVNVAATVATQQMTVHMLPQTAPILPE